MMKSMFRALAVAGAMMLAFPAFAQPVKLDDLTITAPWVRPTPPGAPTAAGYLTVTNNGGEEDHLIGASSPASASMEVHEMTMDGNVMRMRPVAGGVPIPAGKTVTLAPGGYHMMLIAPNRQFKLGETVPVTLEFARAGKVEVMFPVRQAPDATMGNMGSMPGMSGMPGMPPAKAP
jgi:copper(I)-binding protein